MNEAKPVKIIKATPPTDRTLSTTANTQRVAAYVRVSTDHEEQLESYKSQIAYYTDLIANTPSWTSAGIYADEAISGTRTEKRDSFNRLINDCMAGKIDLIITKSLSRFSRNTVDTLKYIRLLKERGIAIIFEQENINTLTTNGELTITILSAVNQQYVENTSDSVKHGLRAKMGRGELVGDPEALGYDKDPVDRNKLIINEAEAEIVRYIFKRYLEGAGGRVIGRELENLGYKTKRGNTTWADTTVLGIIKNEKYIGDLVQGKTTTIDPITQRRLENRGEVDKFYLEGSHPAIIDKATFEKAQAIRNKRNEGKTKPTDKNANKYSRKYAFSCMLKCGFCGNNLSRRNHHSGTPHEKRVWHCTTYTKKGKQYCPECKAIDESLIESAFVQSYNLLAGDNSEVLSEFLTRLEDSLHTTGTEKQLIKVNKLIQNNELKLKKLLDFLLDGTISQSAYAEKKAEVEAVLQPLYDERKVLQETTTDEKTLKQQLSDYKAVLESNTILQEFDRAVFETVIDHVVIGERLEGEAVAPHKITFVYRGGIQPPPQPPTYGDKLCSYTKDNTRGVRSKNTEDSIVELEHQMVNYQRKRYVVMKFIHDEEHIVFKDIGNGKGRKEVFNGVGVVIGLAT